MGTRSVRTVCLTVIAGCFAALAAGCTGGAGSGGSSPPSGPARPLGKLGKEVKDETGNVVELAIYGRDVTDDELAQIKDYPQLAKITLQECKFLTDAGIGHLQNAPELTAVHLLRLGVTDVGVGKLGALKKLEVLELSHTDAEGAGLAELAEIPLTTLEMRSDVATAKGMAALAKLTKLKKLQLHCTTVKLAELPDLTPLAALAELDCYRTKPGDNGIAKLQGLTTLQSLVVDGVGMGDEVVTALNGLAELRHLSIYGAGITNDGLKELALPNLANLDIGGCEKITDAGLANFGGMPNLEELNMVESGVKGAGLPHLASLTKLKVVILAAAQFKAPKTVIADLKKALPELEVELTEG